MSGFWMFRGTCGDHGGHPLVFSGCSRHDGLSDADRDQQPNCHLCAAQGGPTVQRILAADD